MLKVISFHYISLYLPYFVHSIINNPLVEKIVTKLNCLQISNGSQKISSSVGQSRAFLQFAWHIGLP